MAITVYNTLTRVKEEFKPRDPGRVGIYTCGVTPYADTHIGHARPPVLWDVIRRHLEHRGYEVVLVQNITDIDDKIIARAAERELDPLEMAEMYIDRYNEEMEALGVRAPSAAPRATHYIDDMIEMVGDLVERGYAYEAGGDVYFDISQFDGYGKLSNRKADELIASGESGFGDRKRNPGDFALWKSAKPGEPSWDSPWGPGRPGWHIECSAMSMRLLGKGYDFHGGGTDLIFPHHENEIAQSEAHSGPPYVRYWLHHGMLRMSGEKMSKSLGNVVELATILERFPGQAVRYYLLSAHYRKPLQFDWALIEEAERSWHKWTNALTTLEHLLRKAGDDSDSGAHRLLVEQALAAMNAFEEALDDDFNTPRALAAGFDLIHAVNGYAAAGETPDRESVERALEVMQTMCGILGIDTRDELAGRQVVDGLVEILLTIREQMRDRKDWVTADEIRDRLAGLGIVLEDTPHGTRWKWDQGGGSPS